MRILSAILAALAASVALEAHAALTIVEGSPQTAELGSTLAPVRVRVADVGGNAVVGAKVHWFQTLFAPVISSPQYCGIDPVSDCWALTDWDGIATLPFDYGVTVGRHEFRIFVSDASRSIGSSTATLVFDIVPMSQPPRFEVLSGWGQRVVQGQMFDQQFAVRAVAFDGQPIAGLEVTFGCCTTDALPTQSLYAGQPQMKARTDENGVARSSFPTAGQGLGTTAARVSALAPGRRAPFAVDIPYSVVTRDDRTELALQNLWWSGFQENGWGFSITQHEDRFFSVLFAYDLSGAPTWYVVPAGGWEQYKRFVAYNGNAYLTKGSPYYAYDASQLRVGGVYSQLRLEIQDEAMLSMRFQVRLQAEKRIVPQDFTGDRPSPLTGLGDMWWGGPSQNGWGIAIHEQFGGLFSVWFTYDAAGAPTWFVMPDGRWTSANTYEGTIYRTASSSWPDYDARRLQVFALGTYKYTFGDRQNATFEYQLEGRSGTLTLQRQDF